MPTRKHLTRRLDVLEAVAHNLYAPPPTPTRERYVPVALRLAELTPAIDVSTPAKLDHMVADLERVEWTDPEVRPPLMEDSHPNDIHLYGAVSSLDGSIPYRGETPEEWRERIEYGYVIAEYRNLAAEWEVSDEDAATHQAYLDFVTRRRRPFFLDRDEYGRELDTEAEAERLAFERYRDDALAALDSPHLMDELFTPVGTVQAWNVPLPPTLEMDICRGVAVIADNIMIEWHAKVQAQWEAVRRQAHSHLDTANAPALEPIPGAAPLPDKPLGFVTPPH